MADIWTQLQNSANDIVRSVENVGRGAWGFLTQQRWGPSGMKNVNEQGWSPTLNMDLMTAWAQKNPMNAVTLASNMVVPQAGLLSGISGLGGFASGLVAKTGASNFLAQIPAWFSRHPWITGVGALGAGTFVGSQFLGSGGTQVYLPGSTDASKRDTGGVGGDLLGGLLGGGVGGLLTFFILFMLMRNMGGMGGGLFGGSSTLGTTGATPVIVNT